MTTRRLLATQLNWNNDNLTQIKLNRQFDATSILIFLFLISYFL